MRAASRVCSGGEVAALAEVSVEYYAKLECGAIGGVSASVLDAIARALQLDDAERTHLFNLAHTADPTSAGMRPRRRVSTQWTPRRSLTWVLDKITAPAIIRNGRMDLLAANDLGRAMHAAVDTSAGTQPSFARFTALGLDAGHDLITRSEPAGWLPEPHVESPLITDHGAGGDRPELDRSSVVVSLDS